MKRKPPPITAPPLPLTRATRPGGRPRRDHQPPNAFSLWVMKTKLTPEALADKLGVSVSSVYNMRNGYFTPGRDLAVLIAKESRGKVPVDSWPKARPRTPTPPNGRAVVSSTGKRRR